MFEERESCAGVRKVDFRPILFSILLFQLLQEARNKRFSTLLSRTTRFLDLYRA